MPIATISRCISYDLPTIPLNEVHSQWLFSDRNDDPTRLSSISPKIRRMCCPYTATFDIWSYMKRLRNTSAIITICDTILPAMTPNSATYSGDMSLYMDTRNDLPRPPPYSYHPDATKPPSCHGKSLVRRSFLTIRRGYQKMLVKSARTCKQT